MTVQLTNEEKIQFFHNALCNGLGYIQGYGLEVIIDKTTYLKAKGNASTQKLLDGSCYEDVLIQILNDGNSFIIRDNEGEEDHIITLDLVNANMNKVYVDHLMDMKNEEDDAITADVIIQTVIFGEVIYG